MTSGPDSDVGNPFAGFERRFAGISIDFLLLFFLSAVAQSWLLQPLGLMSTDIRPVFLVLGTLYFSLSWWSPMKATPVQFLLRIRVVDKTGESLRFSRAVLRGVLLVLLIAAAMTVFKVPSYPGYLFLAVPAIAVSFLAAITPNRQAGHDFLARSLVVVKDAVLTPETRNQKRPTVVRVILAVLAVGIPVLAMFNMALMQLDRELRARIGYALSETVELRLALQEVYLDEQRWAMAESDLDVATKVDYPDGGYYELEEDGVIRIRFTVIPKLRKISLVLIPTWQEDELDWECRAEGEISPPILPSVCRD